jgi:hypothetical protein
MGDWLNYTITHLPDQPITFYFKPVPTGTGLFDSYLQRNVNTLLYEISSAMPATINPNGGFFSTIIHNSTRFEPDNLHHLP